MREYLPIHFTRSELARAIPHLVFDFFHFRLYRRHLSDSSSAWCNPAVRQAVGYALLVHMRVVWCFFYNPATQDDCTVGHFGALPEFAKAFSTKLTEPPEIRENLNKRLAHLTATRWRKTPPSMDFYRRYFDHLEKLIADFRTALPADLQKTYDERMQYFENRYKERL